MHAPLKPNKCGLTVFREWDKGGDYHLKIELSAVYLMGLVTLNFNLKLSDDENFHSIGNADGDESSGGDVEGVELRQALKGGTT